MFKIHSSVNKGTNIGFFALTYNPFGDSKSDFNHSFTLSIFSLDNPYFLIGKDFWDKIGGNGTYEDLMEIFEELGSEYSDEIRKNYLGLS